MSEFVNELYVVSRANSANSIGLSSGFAQFVGVSRTARPVFFQRSVTSDTAIKSLSVRK
jgi:hypothetical protein